MAPQPLSCTRQRQSRSPGGSRRLAQSGNGEETSSVSRCPVLQSRCRCCTGQVEAPFGHGALDQHRSVPSPLRNAIAPTVNTAELLGVPTAVMCWRLRSRTPPRAHAGAASHPSVGRAPTRRCPPRSRPGGQAGSAGGRGRCGGGRAPRPFAMTRPHSCLKSSGSPRGPSDRDRRRC